MTVHSRPASREMTELLRVSDLIAPSTSAILLQGETGTGKEWLARRIHAASRCSDGPFVTVHCGAIPEGLAEAALFGHEKGAFTGAVRSARGHFEMAQGGTLFLDEIGEISSSVQVKLLRVLQDHTFQPVGSERALKVDVRILAATNVNLAEAVGLGIFRRDLYYRLAVITLDVPPLRDRVEDISGLVETYTRSIAAQLGRPTPRITGGAMVSLERYAWPGNIRELINVLERAMLLNPSSVLSVENFPLSVSTAESPNANGPSPSGESSASKSPRISTFAEARAEATARFEASYLNSLLKSVNGRLGDAVSFSGIRRRTLYTLMKKHGLRKEDFRA